VALALQHGIARRQIERRPKGAQELGVIVSRLLAGFPIQPENRETSTFSSLTTGSTPRVQYDQLKQYQIPGNLGVRVAVAVTNTTTNFSSRIGDRHAGYGN
jgi:hypothetical protein